MKSNVTGAVLVINTTRTDCPSGVDTHLFKEVLSSYPSPSSSSPPSPSSSFPLSLPLYIFTSTLQVVEQAQKAGALGVILLDSRPSRKWRVSSPQTALSLPSSIPLLLLWSEDWMGITFTSLHPNIFLVWNLDSREQFEQLVSREVFTCDSSSLVRLEDRQEEAGCSEGKVLRRNGDLVERDCLQGVCSYLGRPCPFSWAKHLASLPVTVHCSNLTNTDLSFTSSSSETLSLANLRTSTTLSSTCCQGSSKTSMRMQLLNSSCSFSDWSTVFSLAEWQCRSRWSGEVRGRCSSDGMERDVYRLCLVQGGCVLRQFYEEGCNTMRQRGACEGSDRLCSAGGHMSSVTL